MSTVNMVIVNHDTSVFAELALRSFFATHPGLDRCRVAVMDNNSGDGTRDLAAYAAARGVAFRQSGRDAVRRVANSHGEVLRQFILSDRECDFYLIADADICFLSDNTLDRMRDEIGRHPDAWAIQTRYGVESVAVLPDRPVKKHDLVAEMRQKRPYYLHSYQHDAGTADPKDIKGPLRTVPGTAKARCHPFCTLVRNTPAFRRTAELIGLSSALILDNDPERAGIYDTMGLLGAVMYTHGQTYLSSSLAVLHFGGVSYSTAPDTRVKYRQARRLLERYRHGDVPDYTRRDWMLPEYADLATRIMAGWRSRPWTKKQP